MDAGENRVVDLRVGVLLEVADVQLRVALHQRIDRRRVRRRRCDDEQRRNRRASASEQARKARKEHGLASYQVSMYGYFFSVRGALGGRRFKLLAIQLRVSAGSITSSKPPPTPALMALAPS